MKFFSKMVYFLVLIVELFGIFVSRGIFLSVKNS